MRPVFMVLASFGIGLIPYRYVVDVRQKEHERFCLNEAACQATGYSSQELGEMHVWDVDAESDEESWPASLWILLQKSNSKRKKPRKSWLSRR